MASTAAPSAASLSPRPIQRAAGHGGGLGHPHELHAEVAVGKLLGLRHRRRSSWFGVGEGDTTFGGDNVRPTMEGSASRVVTAQSPPPWWPGPGAWRRPASRRTGGAWPGSRRSAGRSDIVVAPTDGSGPPVVVTADAPASPFGGFTWAGDRTRLRRAGRAPGGRAGRRRPAAGPLAGRRGRRPGRHRRRPPGRLRPRAGRPLRHRRRAHRRVGLAGPAVDRGRLGLRSRLVSRRPHPRLARVGLPRHALGRLPDRRSGPSTGWRPPARPGSWRAAAASPAASPASRPAGGALAFVCDATRLDERLGRRPRRRRRQARCSTSRTSTPSRPGGPGSGPTPGRPTGRRWPCAATRAASAGWWWRRSTASPARRARAGTTSSTGARRDRRHPLRRRDAAVGRHRRSRGLRRPPGPGLGGAGGAGGRRSRRAGAGQLDGRGRRHRPRPALPAGRRRRSARGRRRR